MLHTKEWFDNLEHLDDESFRNTIKSETFDTEDVLIILRNYAELFGDGYYSKITTPISAIVENHIKSFYKED